MGAKQNRIINLTILVPPGKTIVIPVSCVEAGRWRFTSDRFRPAEHTLYAQAKAESLAGRHSNENEDRRTRHRLHVVRHRMGTVAR